MRQELDDLNNSLGEDENGMTLHEKLDYLMENSSVKNVTFTVVGGCGDSTDGYGKFSLSATDNNYKKFKIISETKSHSSIYTTSKTLSIGGATQSWKVGEYYDIVGKAVVLDFLFKASVTYANYSVKIELSN